MQPPQGKKGKKEEEDDDEDEAEGKDDQDSDSENDEDDEEEDEEDDQDEDEVDYVEAAKHQGPRKKQDEENRKLKEAPKGGKAKMVSLKIL